MNPKLLPKLRSAEACVGTWLSSGSPVVAELASLCGIDWLLLDMEHGCLPEASLLACLQAIGRDGPAIIVRVPTHEAGLIARVLDWGADGIMAPHVETREQAEALVGAMQYPPKGRRGYSRSVRAYGYGLQSATPVLDGEPLLFAQIESTEGMANVEAIAGVPGVNVLFVGPADLKLSLSVTPSATDYASSLGRVLMSAQANAIHAGILIRDQTEKSAIIQQGFSKIALDSDMAILRAGFQSRCNPINRAAPFPSRAGAPASVCSRPQTPAESKSAGAPPARRARCVEAA